MTNKGSDTALREISKQYFRREAILALSSGEWQSWRGLLAIGATVGACMATEDLYVAYGKTRPEAHEIAKDRLRGTEIRSILSLVLEAFDSRSEVDSTNAPEVSSAGNMAVTH